MVTNLPEVMGGGELAAWGDINNDGKLDLFLTGNSGHPPDIYRAVSLLNEGGGVFTNIGVMATGVNQGGIVPHDYDGDGHLDFFLSGDGGPGNPVVGELHRNQGDGSFTNVGFPYAGWASAAAWGDYNNDGKPDLLFSGSTFTHIYENRGNSFSLANVSLPAIAFGSVAWGDFDNDRDLDLLMAGMYGGTRVLKNDGNGVFTDIEVNFPSLEYSSVAWGDYNNDGKLDIVMAGKVAGVTNTLCRVYKNLGDNSFTNVATLPGFSFGSVAWGDYDNDGYPDILRTGSDRTLIFRNRRDGTFTNINVSFPEVRGAFGTWVDYDNDGDLDCLVNGSTQKVITDHLWRTNLVTWLYRNNVSLSNSPPTAPTGLVAAQSKRVRLSWNRASDSKTPTLGLSYNLRIGTTPGGEDIMPAMAFTNGLRKVLRLGNVNCNTNWLLTNLTYGTYYWSVQAIDSGYAGSPFAPEQSFLRLTPPTAITDAPTNINETAAQFLGRISANGTPGATWIEWGTTTNLEYRTPSRAFPTTSTNVPISEALTNLIAGTTYYYRTASTNMEGTNNGVIVSFQTLPPFKPIADFFDSNYYTSAAWGDHNKDGFLDLMLTQTEYLPTRLLMNNRDGTFNTTTATNLPFVSFASVAWGDSDNDSDLDLFYTGMAHEGYINQVYRTDGTNSFALVKNGSLCNCPLQWADLNSDGRNDLIQVYIIANQGSNSFSYVTPLLTTLALQKSAVADYDNDGLIDIVITGTTGTGVPVTKLFRNLGNMSFSEVSTGIAGINSSETAAPAWGDFDDDGFVDIALTGRNKDSVNLTAVYRNLQGQGFLAVTNFPGGKIVKWLDFDSDGKLDLVVDSPSKFYSNMGNGQFVSRPSNLPPDSRTYWGDFDNDGKLDVLAIQFSFYARPQLFRNMLPDKNMPPSSPTGLSTVLLTNSIRFTWTKAPDDKTPTNALTYNLKIGTTSGGTDIVSPNSTDGGNRLVFEPGNAGSTGSWTIYDLNAGTYYWSVQALDHSLQGSAFSYESSVVATFVPSVTTLDITYETNTTVTLNGRVNANGLQTTAYFEWNNFSNTIETTTVVIDPNNFKAQITEVLSDLPPGHYQYRVVASNEKGISTGVWVKFVLPFKISTVTFLESGEFALSFAGLTNTVYEVMTSRNLVDWNVAGSASETEAGNYLFIDAARNDESRFYKVRQR